MTLDSSISKDEQLRALADGLPGVYKLIERITGSPVNSDFRDFISVTKQELKQYLSDHPELAGKHVQSSEDVAGAHDVPVLIAEGGKWIVCWMDHGERTNEKTYGNLAEAAANYLMAYWQ